MKIPNSEIIDSASFEQLLKTAQKESWELEYNFEKHQVVLIQNDNWLLRVFLPWNQEWDSDKLIAIENFHTVLTVVKAGQAVVGYFHEKELLDHKVFRAYMVRQKQGKSQIKHLKTKGKSRAGSRIRLGETERFFEEISERLNSYENDFPINFWGISCAKTLWPYFFGSETPPPFDSSSKRLRTLPFHFNQGSFEELVQAGKLIHQFHMVKNQDIDLDLGLESSPESEEEDW